MESVRLGKSGQVSIPRAILRKLGIEPDTTMIVDVTADGGILLRPAGVYPIEVYSPERLAEFAAEDAITPEEAKLRTRARRKR